MSTETAHIEKKKALVPKLRFKEFESISSYQRYLFNDIFSFSIGKNIKQNEASPEFETPCVRYGELYHMYNEVIDKVFNRTNLDKSELLFSEGDEILLPSAGEDPLDIGSASALTIKDVAIGRTINILKPLRANVYSQIYTAYYINEKLRKKISKLAKGVSISNVYNSDLKTLTIILPSLPEQQKIASFLSAVDEKIQQLTRKKELLEQYKKGVMQQLFSGKLRFKDPNGKPYPKWEEKKLGEVIEEFAKKSVVNDEYTVLTSSNQGLMRQSDYYGENRLTERENIGFNLIPENHITYRSRSDNRQFTFNLNTLGITGIVSTYYPVFFSSKSDSRFIVTLLNFNKHRVGIYSVGTSQTVLSFNELKKIKFHLPSLEEQQKIANFLTALDAKIETVANQITQAQTFKKGLPQQMFV